MYAITGATGNTGSTVARTLLASGKKVRGLGRSADRLASLTDAGAEAFVCDVKDVAALGNAFYGATAVYAMIPPNMASQDYGADQDEVTSAITSAIKQAGVKHVVTLSSVGADKSSGTGPVAGLHRLEETLNEIPDLNVLHLRAAYFMENTLAQVSIIQGMGLTAGPLRADLKLPMIATHDIGTAAAEALLKLDFGGKQTRELLGQRDISMTEVATIMGNAIGKPDLKYIQLPDEQVRPALVRLGLSSSAADMILELAAALNSGHIRPLETRLAENTTPTSFETFVAEEVIPLYRGRSTAA
jgi:uncharacterized protein YbjT (DUF2867 family)